MRCRQGPLIFPAWPGSRVLPARSSTTPWRRVREWVEKLEASLQDTRSIVRQDHVLRLEHVAKYLQAKLGFALGAFWTLFPRRLVRAACHKFDDACATSLHTRKCVQARCRACVGGRSGLKGPCIASSLFGSCALPTTSSTTPRL